MGIVKEFREFALKGNVLDLAVGVIIGGAFGTIVNSMINDVIMPVVGMAGKADFSNLYVPLNSRVADEVARRVESGGSPLSLADARTHGPVLAYGNFITTFLNFLILAFCVFMVIKLFNTARRKFEAEKAAPAPAGPTKDQELLTEIRDLLAARR